MKDDLHIRIEVNGPIFEDEVVARFSSMSVALAAYDQCLITYKGNRVQLLEGARIVKDSSRSGEKKTPASESGG